MDASAPTSVVLSGLLAGLPEGEVTLGWLVGRLGERSFGIILLLLGLLGLLPGVSVPIAVLVVVPALQMLLARPALRFPRRLAARKVQGHRLARVLRHAVPMLRWLERFVGPRWPLPSAAARRVVGGVVLLLAASLLAPVPLSNVPPALLIVLLAFAWTEQDGALLSAALLAALLLLAVAGVIIWQTVRVGIGLAGAA